MIDLIVSVPFIVWLVILLVLGLTIWANKDICIDFKTKEETRCMRSEWVIDKEIPIFTQDRYYIERWVYSEGDK